jgi:TolA-binding protein
MNNRHTIIATGFASGMLVAPAVFGLAEASAADQYARPLPAQGPNAGPASPAIAITPTLNTELAWLQQQITTLQSQLSQAQTQIAALQQQQQTQAAAFQKLQTAFANHYHVLTSTVTTPGREEWAGSGMYTFNCPGVGQPCTANFALPAFAHGQAMMVMYENPETDIPPSTSTVTQTTSGPKTN